MNKHLILSLALAAFSAFAADTPRRAVAVISIDGMHPDCVLKADEHGLRIPNLLRFLRDGTHASAVRGVLPTVTYPSHTTMLTGASGPPGTVSTATKLLIRCARTRAAGIGMPKTSSRQPCGRLPQKPDMLWAAS